MSKAGLYFKMFIAATTVCIGGPALVYYVSPTEEELFKKYNPELQKRSLEMRETRIKESEEFAAQMIRYSKSKMHIWDIAKIDQARKKAAADAERNQAEEELQKRKEEMRQESLGPVSR